MFKKLILFIIAIICLIAHSIALAADSAVPEVDAKVGDIIQLNFPFPILYKTNNHDISDLVQTEDGSYAVKFTGVGDVIITAVHIEKGKYGTYPFLFHVSAADAAAKTAEVTPADASREMTLDEYEQYRQKPDSTNFAARVTALCNAERAKVGAKPLSLDAQLQRTADIRAQEIIQKFSHTRPNGLECFSIFPGRYGTKSENIAAGSETPEAVVEQWMNSPGHRANILNPVLRKIGVGYAHDAHAEYTHYWVQCFSS